MAERRLDGQPKFDLGETVANLVGARYGEGGRNRALAMYARSLAGAFEEIIDSRNFQSFDDLCTKAEKLTADHGQLIRSGVPPSIMKSIELLVQFAVLRNELGLLATDAFSPRDLETVHKIS